MSLKFEKIRYKNNAYAVMDLQYKDLHLPIVTDWDDFQKLKDMKKSWKCNKYGFISCSHTLNDSTKEIFLHELVMAMKQNDAGRISLNKPVIHINRIGLDNRRANLIYDTPNKDLNKNLKKKKRTIKLPPNSGISVEEIPTYVWYMKPNGSHGERFMVEIGDLSWKTTSSKKLSLRYKLEEAKLFLRQLKKERAELFEDYSMNGDYTKDGLDLIDSYYTIIQRAGYDNITKADLKSTTDQLIKPGSFSRKEKNILKSQGSLIPQQEGGQKRRVINRLPPDSGVRQSDIPKYAYYRPSFKNRGDYFVVENHPKQNVRIWQTTSSTKISTQEKFVELLEYINSL